VSESSDSRSAAFLKISGQFKLGSLITESSHPVTARLSEVAARDAAAGLDLLFQADADVLTKYREFVESGRAVAIREAVLGALRRGGNLFFTGCGSTGRLSLLLASLWRDFWQRQSSRGLRCAPSPEDWERRAVSVMAGGDFALIKSVEGFEDFAAFGRKQIGDLGVSEKDVVFAITEGGETSFVIGTAWKAAEAGAKVYFVYNNPDDVLCRFVERSREVIRSAAVEKINLTTGPMSITGSTRMQATTIQLCVLGTVLEMVLRDLMRELEPGGPCDVGSAGVPEKFLEAFGRLARGLRAPEFLGRLASFVALEEEVYRNGGRNNYFADRFALDVLTDTTERSPTFCTPPFRKFDDTSASESWAFLFTPASDASRAWTRLLGRRPQCVEWSDDEVRALAGGGQFEKTRDVVRRIGGGELLRFRIGRDGLASRPPRSGDGAVAILGGEEAGLAAEPDGFVRRQLDLARAAGARTGVIWVGAPAGGGAGAGDPERLCLEVPAPPDDSLLGILRHAALKLVLNALSTCTMVRLGRVAGNFMIWVVPSNLKLIDRATRYIEKLAGLNYEASNRLLFEVIEFIEPRMKSDRAYPPAVAMAVLRARRRLTLEEAERVFSEEGLGWNQRDHLI
jgi:N-acetylmuramic acid 6-phosphate etherase